MTNRRLAYEVRVDTRHLSLVIPRYLCTAIPTLQQAALPDRVDRLVRPQHESATNTARLTLTDRVDTSNQIRFSLLDRIKRALLEFADYVQRSVQTDTVLGVYNSAALDPASKYFASIFGRVCDRLTIEYRDGVGGEVLPLTEVEHEVHRLLSEPSRITHEGHRFLTRTAWQFLRNGDPWAAVAALDPLGADHRTGSENHALGSAQVSLGETVEAERNLQRYADSGSYRESAKAKYSIAMLYARHHPAHLRSDQKSAEILDSAFGDIESLVASDVRADVAFSQVFNRNGMALLLVRKGLHRAAVESLERGMARLDDDSDRDFLHKSVLIYNLAQIYRRTGKFAEAIVQYERLLRIDPNMAEYHCELALCHMEIDAYDTAVRILQHAVSLDPYVPESHALLGYCYGHTDEYESAAASHRIAWRLNPGPKTMYAYVFYLLKVHAYDEVIDVIDGCDMTIPPELESNVSTCHAEALAGMGRRSEAVECLRALVIAHPHDGRARRNLKALIDRDTQATAATAATAGARDAIVTARAHR